MAEYIEREALIKKLCWEQCGRYEKCNEGYDCYDISLIAAFPAADVAPVVHGRWGQTEYWKRANKHLILYKTNRCSICNCDISSRLAYNYCPNCGCHMDGGNK